jgi:myo-inositol-1-phosphate synthase
LPKIRLAIAGVGNCASALLQGVEFYGQSPPSECEGLLHHEIGGYRAGDILPVAAFDVDYRKVGLPLSEALFAPPNCTRVFQPQLPDYGVTVEMGPPLDGVAPHMLDEPAELSFRVAERAPCDVAQVLRESGAEVLVCYLPVGSQKAVEHYAEACLAAGVAMVNCVPVFIASDDRWAERFRRCKLPVVGDDIKSQVGATILHRVLARLISERGGKISHTYQLNTGGNTDFLNMTDRKRLSSKKTSKTEAVQSQLVAPLPAQDIHVGPSDYVAWQKDKKVCFLRVEWKGFGSTPMELELRFSGEDSPNSGGMAIDAIRCAKAALDHGWSGPLEAVASATMKHPPHQTSDSEAAACWEAWLERLKEPSKATVVPQAASS